MPFLVACFYVKQDNSKSRYYRAVYLLKRTVKDLINAIAEKFDVEPNRISHVSHITPKGLHIIVDEDVVRELPEGQDMMVEFHPVRSDHPIKAQYMSTSVAGVTVDGDLAPGDVTVSDALEMWLNY